MSGPVDLYTARSEFVRHCMDVCQARETVHQLHPGARYVALSDDFKVIVVRFPGTVKVYTYEVRPAVSAMIVSFPSRQEPAGERRGA
jgi:hypothetical protein